MSELRCPTTVPTEEFLEKAAIFENQHGYIIIANCNPDFPGVGTKIFPIYLVSPPDGRPEGRESGVAGIVIAPATEAEFIEQSHNMGIAYSPLPSFWKFWRVRID